MAYNYPQFYKPRPVVNPNAIQPGQTGQMSDEQIQQLIQQILKEQSANGGGSAGGEIAAGGGAGVGASQLGGSSALAANPGANAAWNAGAMEAGGAPMTLADGGAAAAPEAGSAFLGTAAPVAGAAAGAYLVGKGINDIRKGRKDNSTKGKLARGQTFITSGGTSEIARGIMGGKNKDQKGRDANRKALQEKGLYDKDFNLQLSDGSMVNMGRDGSKGQYNVDLNEQGIGDIIASVDPLAAIVSGGDKKRRNDLAGELTNAIKGSKDPRAEARALYAKYGIDASQANELLGNLGGDDTGAFQNSVNTLFSGQVSKPKGKPTPIPRAPSGNNGGLQGDGTMFVDNKRTNDPGFTMDPKDNPFKNPSAGGQKGMSALKFNNGAKDNATDRMYMVGRDGPALPGMEKLMPKIPDVMTQARLRKDSPGFKDGKKINYGRK